MTPQCAQIVQDAAKAMGRKPLSQGQLKDIDDRLSRTMRELARTDPNWQRLSTAQRIAEATKVAVADIAAEAQRKVANAQMQIVQTAATESRIIDALHHADSRSQALVHDMDLTDQSITGVKMEAMGGLMRLLEAAKSGQGASPFRRLAMFLFDAENPVMTRDLAREIFGQASGATGNKIATEGAKAWLKVIEDLRQRFNAAGGDVGKLDYGYLPQPHDVARVRAAGMDAWVTQMLPRLDRSRYVDEAGARLNDLQVQAILRGVWETISTDGLNKMTPGEFQGTGARANRGLEQRELHFKDADAYLDYLAQYGRGGMYDAITGHVGRMARDIGLVERYGPNPSAQMRLQFDLAAKADGRQVNDLPRSFGLKPQSYWDVISGVASSPASAKLAQIGGDIRNVQVLGKLGGALLSSVTDLGTYIVTTGYNKLPYWQAIANIGKTATSQTARDFLTTHGIIAESMRNDLSRWTGDNVKQTWSGRIANSTLKLSLLNAWTDTLRRAFSLTMMQGLARMSSKDWGALTEWDRTHLERKGITETDWSVIRKAELTDFQGKEHLTPEAIRDTQDPNAPQVVSKVLGLIQDESEYAVLNPDLATKTLASGGGLQRGTVNGELARSVMQFKSFPIAMISRHWRRMLDAPEVTDGSAPALGNRLAYLTALGVSTTALGAIALQAKQITSGKDPIDMTGPHATKFWLRAAAQGGGASIVGDLILNDPGASTQDAMRAWFGTLAGPSISTAAQGGAIAVENVWKQAKGKQTHAAAETLNLMRQNTPYLNLWYTKAAVDHGFMHALQESLSPGYLGRMQKQAAQDWGQGYWWRPGTGLPERAPDIEKAIQ